LKPKYLLLIIPIVFGIIPTLFAQDVKRGSQQIAFTASGGAGNGAAALAFTHNIGIGKSKKFKVGFGLRFSSYFSGKKDYVTAPSSLTSASQNLGTIFSESYEQNYDTVHFNNTQTNMLNLLINLEYNVYGPLDVGFNIDAIGVGFGPTGTGIFQTSLANPYAGKEVSGKPNPWNVLLTSDNDIGSLNSEGYIRYRRNQHWGYLAGFTFLFSEFKTDNKLTFNNDRFRYKSLMGMIGITYKL
jgi:hypothetical protein